MRPKDKMIFARFANATWKAGQPFRGLGRITRATFTPLYFLTEPDIQKDMVQLRTAAQLLLSLLLKGIIALVLVVSGLVMLYPTKACI